MGLVKRTYVDGETVITAANLNDIQDEIIQNASDISTKGTYSKPTGGIPKTDLASPVQDSLDNADTAYQKPSGGIPSTDMTTAVQTSLGKADSAYQKPSGGIPSTDLASAVQTSLGKADTAYQKPSGGVPSTDLASAVQTSLGKADTALQSSDIDNTLTATGKAADAEKTGDEISDLKNTLNSEIATRQTYVRPNLLDNWYFIGGGSQVGDGKFPINQRGQTSYGASQYSVDRWYNNAGGTGIVVSSDYLTITSGSVLSQKVPKAFASAKITMSVIGTNGVSDDLTYGTADFTGSTTPVTFVTGNDFQLYMVDDGAGNIVFYIAALATKGIKAVKVEIGDNQTLAHQENGVWVLNEIPNYAEELAKCQRYYYKTPTAYSAIMLPATNSILVNSVNFPVQMRDTPHTVAITSIMPSNSPTPITPSGTIGHIESPVSLTFISSTASDFSTAVPGYFVQFTASADL